MFIIYLFLNTISIYIFIAIKICLTLTAYIKINFENIIGYQNQPYSALLLVYVLFIATSNYYTISLNPKVVQLNVFAVCYIIILREFGGHSLTHNTE